MQTGQAQDLPRRCTSVGATLVVARSRLPVSKTQCMGTYYLLRTGVIEPMRDSLAKQGFSCTQGEPLGVGHMLLTGLMSLAEATLRRPLCLVAAKHLRW